MVPFNIYKSWNIIQFVSLRGRWFVINIITDTEDDHLRHHHLKSHQNLYEILSKEHFHQFASVICISIVVTTDIIKMSITLMYLTQQYPGWGSKFQLWNIRISTPYLYKLFVKLEYKFSTPTPAVFIDSLDKFWRISLTSAIIILVPLRICSFESLTAAISKAFSFVYKFSLKIVVSEISR